MKRFLKIAFIIPILFLTSIFAFACGEITMQSISLSIKDATYSNGYYYVEKTDKAITIDTVINPSDFGPKDLTWKSSNTTVATVYFNSLRTEGVGETTITASYKNTDGKQINATLRLSVNESNPEITFNTNALSSTYNGLDQKEKFKAVQDNGSGSFVNDGSGKFKYETNGDFTYEYYNYQTKQMATEIVDAGSYKIICKSVNNPDIQTTVDITINKYTLSFMANTYNYIEYGDALPEGLVNTSKIPSDFLTQTEIGTDFYGIGKDEQVVIGKKVDTTGADVGSSVSSYKTNVYFELKDEYKSNYELTANVTQTSLNIVKKKIVVVVDNQSLIYGQSVVLNKYKMYSYKNYTTAGEDLVNLLLDTSVDYASNIYLGAPSYKIASIDANEQTTYTNASLNDAGVLDVLFSEDGETVLPYNLFYDGATSRGNVDISQVISGEITVNQRQITILPQANQSKNYAQPDPKNIEYEITSGSFVNQDHLKGFLNINYNLVLDNTGNDDVDENNPNYNYNYTAPVGKYFYNVDNSLNRNYKISLEPSAVEDKSANADNSDKIVFEVKPCDIYVEFADVTDYYKSPNGKGANNQNVHTLSYYSKTNAGDSGITPNYKTTFKSLKVNGQEYVTVNESGYVLDETIKDSSFDANGRFYVVVNKTPKSETPTYENIGGFYVLLNLTKIENPQNCFASYFISPSIYSIDGTSNVNYKFDSSTTSKLNLNKVPLKVIPTLDETLMSKVYDATDDIQANFGYFADGFANTDVYYTLDDTSLDIRDILLYPNPLLTLAFKQSSGGDNKYIRINDDGTEEVVDNMRASGKYKVMLTDMSTLENGGFVEGQEYYDISLDDSRVYYYRVKPRPLTILPSSGQSKVYASFDQVLTYSILNMAENSSISPEEEGKNPVTIDGYQITGSLSRASGETVGTYQIKLNNLDFGPNFKLSIAENPVYYEITKRSVKVKPIEYNTIYGEDYPTQIGYEKEVLKTSEDELLNTSVLKDGPTFSGQFVVNGTKIGNYYPVKIVDGKITGYQILQGSFVVDNNYSILFDDTSLFTVNKRPIILNIKAQSKTLMDYIQTTNVYLDTEFYEVSNIVDSATHQLKLDELNNETSIYTVKSYTLTIFKNGSDVSGCYDVTLGKNVVYNIDVAMVYLKIMDKTLLDTTVDVVYNGAARDNTYTYVEDKLAFSNDDFTLVTESSDFVIDKQTNFVFKYFTFSNGRQTQVDKPKDVGSYTAQIDLGTEDDDYKIVIYNQARDEYITFDTLDENVVDNYALSISNVGYLNITKANLTVTDSSLLRFESSLQYGTSDLSKLVENDYVNSRIIFQGVGEDKIVLKEFGNLNYKTTITKEELLSYNANSEYIINLQVEAVKLNGTTPEVDSSGNQVSNNNYNPLYVNVSLRVIPMNFVYSDFQFTIETTDGKIVYNTLSKSVTLSLLTDEKDEETGKNIKLESSNIVYNYEYVRLATVYNESATGEFEYKAYTKEFNAQTGKEEDKVTTETFSKSLNDITLKTARRQIINGTYYIIINDEFAVLISDNQEDVPKSAGLYICFATCQTDSNHTFAQLQEGDEEVIKGQNVTFSCVYEIEKSQDINVVWKKDSFYYTTVFDFANPNTLPFEYDIPTEVKDSVEYILEGDVEVPINNMLNVGEYSVSIKVNTINYYYKNTFKFNVTDLPADIVVPLSSSYIYNGSVINSFLTSIGATQKDKDGNARNTIYYTLDSEEFSFVFKKVFEDNTTEDITTDVNLAPSEVGNYILQINYKSKEGNYSGIGYYNYSIIRKSYSGSIGFTDTTISYDPSLTQQEFYDLIIGRMFTIGIAKTEYTLSLRDGTDNVNISPESSFADYKIYNSVGQKTLYLTIDFKDDITASSTLKALLNIQRYALESSDFAFLSNSTEYEYTGYNIYHALKYQNIDLSPDKQGNTTIYNGEDVLYYVKYNAKTVTVSDRLEHELFELTYKYTRQYSPDNYDELVGYPVVPNTAVETNNNYRVQYNFNFGANYSGRNISYNYIDYTIKKSAMLIISYSDEKIEYTGDSLSGFVPYDLKVTNNRSSTVSNLNYTICYNSSELANSYTESKGVYLLLYFTKDGEKINASNVINEGTYQVNMSLYCYTNEQDSQKPAYKVTDFFENFEFGLNSASMNVFASNITENGEYGYVYSKTLVIQKAKYTISNYAKVLDITNVTVNSDTLVLSKETSVLNVLSEDLNIKICKVDSSYTVVDSNITSDYVFKDNDLDESNDVYLVGVEYCFILSDANHEENVIKFILV